MLSTYGVSVLLVGWTVIAIWLVWLEWSYQRKVRHHARERRRFAEERKSKGINIDQNTRIHNACFTVLGVERSEGDDT